MAQIDKLNTLSRTRRIIIRFTRLVATVSITAAVMLKRLFDLQVKLDENQKSNNLQNKLEIRSKFCVFERIVWPAFKNLNQAERVLLF